MFSDREMAVFVLAIQPDPSINEFFVISLPSAHEVGQHVTRGEYLAIERVTEKEDGSVEWTMAQTSDSGGSIPRWIQERAVTGSVVADVPSFINWVKKQ